ncbi:OmpA family protein [Vibrio agarivorans]|uniref:OmpA family protein n=1 Tax=Vibrio agarivorans TaxID=153622 RepID=A0ABT7XZT1_9VIBR|nr:OmpA family protein [Vibrio agarivorans]MDN2481039.1 OmpA family protein [Vibrio agarivorans]
MKTRLLSVAILGALLSSQALADAVYYEKDTNDEYDYRDTPVPDQTFDLLDDDKDGVINARDMCPGTPIGAEIDNEGCGTMSASRSQMQIYILFENDSDVIGTAFMNQIRDMAMFLEDFPQTSIELKGYTSKVGSDEYNLDLSKRRAASAESALKKYGITDDRIRIVGFGESELVAQGDEEVSHAQNRRVVATVVGLENVVDMEWNIFTTLPNKRP